MEDSSAAKHGLLARLVSEARRRHVFRVAGLYAGTAFVVLQLADIAVPRLGFDDTAISVLLIITAAGFPTALLATWIMDVSGDRSHMPGRMVDAVIVLLALGVAYLYGERLFLSPEKPGSSPMVTAPVAADASFQQSDSAQQSADLLRNSIAVLPFENLSPDPNNAYFAAGIHEEILNQLAKIKDLAVIARTSVLQYAGVARPIRDIATELNVATVMEGSVRYAGNRVRITTQLIDASSGSHLWSETYDRQLTDLFDIESDIAANITDAMKVEFSVVEREAISRAPTDNFEAYSHYLKANALISRQLKFRPALVELDKAIELDPNFAVALGAKAYYLAASLIALSPDGSPETPAEQAEITSTAEELATRALSTDPNLGDAYLTLSIISQVKRQWADRLTYSAKAMEVSPNHPLVIFERARVLLDNGEHVEALSLFEKSQAVDPRNTLIPFFAAGQLANAQQWNAALAWTHRFIQGAPDWELGHSSLAIFSMFAGDADTASSALRDTLARMDLQRIQSAPTDIDFVTLNNIGWVYRQLGDEQGLKDIAKLLENISSMLPYSAGLEAFRYLVVGKPEQSAKLFLSIVEADFPVGNIIQLKYYSDHPIFDPIRDQPDFQKTLRLLNVPEA